MEGSLKGKDALLEYRSRFPNDPLDDITEEDKGSFEFDTTPVPMMRVRLDYLLVESGFASSVTQANRLIMQGAVKIRGEKTFDKIELLRTDEAIPVRVGKREKKVKIECTPEA